MAEKRQKSMDLAFDNIENFADEKYKHMGKHRPTNYNCVNLGTVVKIINYLSRKDAKPLT